MAKFKRLPVVVEAEQYNLSELEKNEKKTDYFIEKYKIYYDHEQLEVMIPTNMGNRVLSNGDWIITGIKGEIDICRYDLFEKYYEPVTE